jgi:molecular chaperone HtpG
MAATEQFAFKAEIQQLLNILVHSLYTDRDIFLRELISNASDALSRVQFEMLTNPNVRDADAELYIEIKPDEDAGTLTISDTGIGMTHADLVENLGVIAHSGAKAFIEMVKARQDGTNTSALSDVIGQFGVGFYSVFMVADKVRVISRSHLPDEPAYVWESGGGDTFTIEPAERDTRGTDIIITLKDDAKDYLKTYKLKEIVRRHSDYITFPIHVGDEEEPTNKQTAIWRQDPKEVTDDQYNDFYKTLLFDFQPPAHRLHLRIDSPLQFYALLYIPSNADGSLLGIRREPGLKLYARKVLIQEATTDLLPDYLQFVAGVVDSEDLPLSVSRESVQANRVMANLKKTLSGRILTELKRLTKSKPDVYAQIFENFGRFIKQGVVVSPSDRPDIEPLLYFPSTNSASSDEWVSLGEYVERMAENQQDIYYVLGDDFASASRSPHLDAFRKRGIEVLYFVDPADTIMLMGLPDFQGHKLRSADEADIDLSEIGTAQEDDSTAEPLSEESFVLLRDKFAEVLGDRVKDVRESKNLVGSPARLVSDEADPSRNMYRINRLMDREYQLPVKILELNPRHALLHNLSGMIGSDSDNPIVGDVIEQVFETALLQDGIHPDPASMAARLYAIMQAATASQPATAPAKPTAKSRAKKKTS